MASPKNTPVIPRTYISHPNGEFSNQEGGMNKSIKIQLPGLDEGQDWYIVHNTVWHSTPGTGI